ncbi:MAG: PIG-L family deacetylase, partial [Cytophagales bacterium]|nr:PIG-L family deacetylase [Armatimonadota bacterium]
MRRLSRPFAASAPTPPAADTSALPVSVTKSRRLGAASRPALRTHRATAWRRGFVLLLILPVLAAGGAASAYYYRLHRWATFLKLSDLPDTAPLTRARRILVLSPHCDDETLGVGALISDSRRAGIPVTVAFLTNGDGFPVAAGRALREVNISPADYVRFAEIRQRESLSAGKELGVAGKDVVFLGYPDRGLKSLWETNWSPRSLFRSPYTQHKHSPYARTYSPQTSYCGESLLKDLVRLMEQVRPTDIYVTHPADDHPDHYAAAAFAQAALRECRNGGGSDSWATRSRLRFYLVHRGDWPLPQGLHPDQPLLPPVGLAGLDTHWSVFRASSGAIRSKQRALERYVSQTEISGRFLRSFVRINEIFGEMPDCAACPEPALPALVARQSRGADTGTPGVSARDATGDDLMRYAAPAADLTGLAVRSVSPGV